MKRSTLAVAALLVLTEAVYVRPSGLLIGSDFYQLHVRRIEFARDALFGPQHFLPGWYPRELMGTPFWANLQNFPWIPTRLIILLFDPQAAYGVGIAIAAALAALFTYLYCRRVGISEIGAVAAGWTFACAGFFSSRVMPGHLPLLEAYPALPLLLWLADRAIAPEREGYQARDLIALAIASACVTLAGHPQVPFYSLATAMLYVLVPARGWRRIRVIAALALGVGMTMAAWGPMLLLVQRSTRVLHLAPASNDIPMPYGRLPALILPGFNGWPELVGMGDKNEFHGYPHDGYFWDTASYIGLLPLLVVILLLIRSLVRKRLPEWRYAFLAEIGTGAFLLSLPVMEPLHRLIPGTFLRSPARLLYLSTFAVSVALGAGVDIFLESDAMKLRLRYAVVALCLALHGLDLGGFARLFVQTEPREQKHSLAFESILERELDDGRIAADGALMPEYRVRYDDAGVFDSLLLANPYRAMVKLSGLPADYNEQRLDESEFAIPALQAAGVRFVITTTERKDLPLAGETEDAYLYRVRNPAPRASFLEQPAAYSRPSSDEIVVKLSAGERGAANVLESYDPGWSAEVDGAPARVDLASDGFSMAIPVEAGRHAIRLRYHTPGIRMGVALSILSAALFAGLIAMVMRGRPTSEESA